MSPPHPAADALILAGVMTTTLAWFDQHAGAVTAFCAIGGFIVTAAAARYKVAADRRYKRQQLEALAKLTAASVNG